MRRPPSCARPPSPTSRRRSCGVSTRIRSRPQPIGGRDGRWSRHDRSSVGRMCRHTKEQPCRSTRPAPSPTVLEQPSRARAPPPAGGGRFDPPETGGGARGSTLDLGQLGAALTVRVGRQRARHSPPAPARCHPARQHAGTAPGTGIGSDPARPTGTGDPGRMTTEIETPHGTARAHVQALEGPRGTLVLGHGAGGGVGARDLVATAEAAYALGLTVVLVEQPYRVAGRRSPAPAAQLDAAWITVIEHLRGVRVAARRSSRVADRRAPASHAGRPGRSAPRAFCASRSRSSHGPAPARPRHRAVSPSSTP